MRKKCKRRNCIFYSQEMDNNCVALHEIYENVYDCKFHKVKEGKPEQSEEVEE